MKTASENEPIRHDSDSWCSILCVKMTDMSHSSIRIMKYHVCNVMVYEI